MDESGRLVPKRGLNFTLSNKTGIKEQGSFGIFNKNSTDFGTFYRKTYRLFLVNFQKMISGAKKYAYAKTDYTFLEKA